MVVLVSDSKLYFVYIIWILKICSLLKKLCIFFSLQLLQSKVWRWEEFNPTSKSKAFQVWYLSWEIRYWWWFFNTFQADAWTDNWQDTLNLALQRVLKYFAEQNSPNQIEESCTNLHYPRVKLTCFLFQTCKFEIFSEVRSKNNLIFFTSGFLFHICFPKTTYLLKKGCD